MWRFVLISFAALALTFYQLSGGADYRPAPNSIQARAGLVRPRARPTPQADDRRARAMAEVTASMEALGQTAARRGKRTAAVSVRRAAPRRDAISILRAEASRPKAELLDLPAAARSAPAAPQGGDAADPAIEAAIAAAMGEVVVDPSRIRRVKENLVDLRTGPGLSFERVATLAKGTELGILEDPGNGWLKVRVLNGYQSGWLAEWLLTEPQ